MLLQNNNGLLPLAKERLSRVAVIGDCCTDTDGGSGHVVPPDIITPLWVSPMLLATTCFLSIMMAPTSLTAAADLAASYETV